MNSEKNYSPGLENVIAGETEICLLDPDKGLFYRGYSIEELFEKSNFEEVSFLILNGKLPTTSELEEFRKKLSENYFVDKNVFKIVKDLPKNSDMMDILRTLVSLIGTEDVSEKNDYEKAISLIAKMPSLIANSYRILNGLRIIKPKENYSIAENFLYILNGKKPDKKLVKIFDKTLILYAEHEFNASSFTARVIASTLSDYYSAIVGAIGALKGPLHGGANEKAMRMLLEIGSVDNVENYLAEHLKIKGWRIMGFGHRVYKGVEDPRAKAMKNLLKEACEYKNDMKLYEVATKVEEYVLNENFMQQFIPGYGTEKSKFYPNVDFYCGPLYYVLGIPLELYTPIFALARVVGWSAHIIEQQKQMELKIARLFRPRSIYIGKKDLKYIPIEERV